MRLRAGLGVVGDVVVFGEEGMGMGMGWMWSTRTGEG